MKKLLTLSLLFFAACQSPNEDGKCMELTASQPLSLGLCEGKKCAITLSTNMSECTFALDAKVVVDDSEEKQP